MGLSIVEDWPELEHRQVMNAINHAAGRYHADDERTAAQRMADGLINLAKAYASGAVTGGREQPTVIVGCTPETIAGLSDQPGWTAHGDRIPADVLRQLAENAYIGRIVMAGTTIIELGNRVRFAADDLYQALMIRDGGCRYPGCTVPAAWCEIDHLIPVEHGGGTNTRNLVLWCTFHHHVEHRAGVIVIGDATDLHLQMPDGRRLHGPPKGRTTPAAA